MTIKYHLSSFFIVIALCIILHTANARADDWLHWQSNNVQMLYGQGFRFTDNSQTTLTFEHANGWKYGDNFFYIDYSIDEPDTVNFEVSPRLSFGKMTGADLSYGILQDVLLAGTYERGIDFRVFLYGLGADLDIPGFDYVQVNAYVRDNPDFDDTGWQTTWVWSRPFEAGGLKMTFDGYFDYADYEEGTTNFFTQPQLLFDAGDAFNFAEDGKIQAGVEWRYWHNLYGIEGVTESVPQVMVKWNL